MRLSNLLPAFLLLIAGCKSSPKPNTVSQITPADQGWLLTDTRPDAGEPALLWNGLIGVRIARTGAGLRYDGKPLGFYMIDEYQHTGEEKILPMPNPILVAFSVGNELFNDQNRTTHDFLKSGGTPLDPRHSADYSQSLDMRDATLTTHWSQSIGGAQISLKSETVLHPTERVIAQRWTLTSSKPNSFSIKTLDYGGPNDRQVSVGADVAADVSISASPSRVVAMKTSLQGATPGALSRAAGFRIQEGEATPNRSVVFERVLSFGSHSPTSLPSYAAANMADLKAHTPKLYSFDQVVEAAKQYWAQKWKTDIEIDGPPQDQLAVRSFLFYLRSAINPTGGMSVSPYGLSGNQYNGHVFWDADDWVFPALALLDPEGAAAIPAYRLDKAKQAVANFVEWYRAGSPNEYGKQSRPAGGTQVVPAGLKYPWESSVSGKETCPFTMLDEVHVTGSVLWGLTQAEDLGFLPTQKVDALAALAANTYLAMAQRPRTGRELSILGIKGPDESVIEDNDLYTNLLAEWLANGRRWVQNPSPAFVIPHDSMSLLTFANDNLKTYKQASAILSIYPLQYPPAEAEASTMMDRFVPNVYPYGPAMNESLNALIWARLGDPRAYQAWQRSWEPFIANPLLLFTEKRKESPAYFTTGAAGCLESVLYGFLGFRIDFHRQDGAVWSHKLLRGSVLSLNPHLPDSWKSVKLKNFTLLGETYTLTATHSACSVSQGV